MALLFAFFTIVLSLCVVGLIVLALASILASVRDDWKLKKSERKPRPGDSDRPRTFPRYHGGGEAAALIPKAL